MRILGLLPFLRLLGAPLSNAQEKEKADKLSAAESEKLDDLRLLYDLAREEIRQKQWVEPMGKLRNEYKQRMERVQKSFEQSGCCWLTMQNPILCKDAKIPRSIICSRPTKVAFRRSRE